MAIEPALDRVLGGLPQSILRTRFSSPRLERPHSCVAASVPSEVARARRCSQEVPNTHAVLAGTPARGEISPARGDGSPVRVQGASEETLGQAEETEANMLLGNESSASIESHSALDEDESNAALQQQGLPQVRGKNFKFFELAL